MKLYYTGHDYRYACEQSLLVLFPTERPEYSEEQVKENAAYLSLHYGKTWVTASCRIYRDGVFDGSARVRKALLTDELSIHRLLPKILRLAFYRAAERCTGKSLAWGALTGVRPAKLATRLLEEGLSAKSAVSRMKKDFFVSPSRAELCVETAKASLAVKRSLEPQDVCLYVGIPFCPTRCAYCSFVSIGVERSHKLLTEYLPALYREIDATGEAVKKAGLRPVALYIGGGTPTTLSAPQLAELMERISAAFDLSAIREYTVEAGRPDTITPEKLEALKLHGCDRVSINPQTMNDSVLEAIGRRHSAADTLRAYGEACDAGFAAVNMDLIAGLPTDTAESFAKTLDTVLSLDPENITVHTLSMKKGSHILLEGRAIPGEEEVSAMLDYASEKLYAAGYRPYYLYRQKYISGGFENIGWCKPGFESVYNLCIMEELCTILAMGGGGSTKLTNPNTGYIARITDKKYPREYIDTIDDAVKAREEICAFYRREHLLPDNT